MDTRQPIGLFHFWRGCLVHIDAGPHFNLVWPTRVPDAERTRGSAQERKIGEERADNGEDLAEPRPQALLYLGTNSFLVVRDDGSHRVSQIPRGEGDDAMAVPRLEELPPGAWPGSTTRGKTHLHRR